MADQDDEKRWYEKKLKDMWPAQSLTLIGFLSCLAVAIIAINMKSLVVVLYCRNPRLGMSLQDRSRFIQTRLQIRRPHYLRSLTPSSQSRWNQLYQVVYHRRSCPDDVPNPKSHLATQLSHHSFVCTLYCIEIQSCRVLRCQAPRTNPPIVLDSNRCCNDAA